MMARERFVVLLHLYDASVTAIEKMSLFLLFWDVVRCIVRANGQSDIRMILSKGELVTQNEDHVEIEKKVYLFALYKMILNARSLNHVSFVVRTLYEVIEIHLQLFSR